MRPVFNSSDSFKAMRDALLHERTLVVRGAIDPGVIANVCRNAAYAYDRWDYGAASKAEKDLFFHGHIPVVHEAETIANGEFFSAFVSEVMRWQNRLTLKDMLLRRVLPPSLTDAHVLPKIRLHQDDYFATISGSPPTQLCFTIWVPLVSCGKDAPGLSVVVGSDLPVVMGKPLFGWKQYIWRKYGRNALWSPELNAGDLLVFTSRVIHGSYVTSSMTKPRYSVEIRGGIN